MRKKICILYNSYSGKGKGKKMTMQIKQLLTAEDVKCDDFENDWPDKLEVYDQVWIVGGDGTLNFYINKYKSQKTPITIFPGGTGNDIRWKLYGDIEIEKQIAIALTGKTKEIDHGVCNGKRFINCVGIGFDGEVLKNMALVRSLGGFMGYYVTIIKCIFKYKEPRYEIKYDDVIINDKYLIVNVANSSRTGGGILVSPLAEIDDGLLNLVTVEKLSILKRLKVLPIAEKGKHLRLDFVNHKLIKSISIACEKEIDYQLDGELLSDKILNLSISKDKLLVLVDN